MKLLLAYCRTRWKDITLFLVCAGVFAAVFALADLPVELVLYAALLCAAICLPVFVVCYLRFARRHKRMQQLLGQKYPDLAGLPKAEGLCEQDDQALLAGMERLLREQVSDADCSRRERLDFVTLWVHQIKTPLAAMRLLVQGRPEGWPDAMEAELLKTEQYVQMVLNFQQLEQHENDYQLTACQLDSLVRQAVRNNARLFAQKNLPLELDTDWPNAHTTSSDTALTDMASPDTVLTDEKWAVFLLEQLLSNALKYTRQGKIIVTAKDGVVTVADTGIGIAPEDLPRVFEKGFTGYNGRSVQKSSGIGLYVCKKIADRLGHHISIRSDVGVGTVVTVDFRRTTLHTAD